MGVGVTSTPGNSLAAKRLNEARENSQRMHWHAIKERYWPVWVLIAICTMVGLLVFRSYGLSTDEPLILEYVQHVTQILVRNPLVYELFGTGNLDRYGPAYFVLARLFAGFGTIIFPAIGPIAFWHLAGFLFFQLAVFSIYRLALRWMDQWGAFGAALLFATQPILWGHAFINPKDSPFMVLFLASVMSGLVMADHILGKREDDQGEAEAATAPPGDPRIAPRPPTARLAVAIGGLALLVLVLGAATIGRVALLRGVVQFIHGLPPSSPIQILYASLTAGMLATTIKTYVIGSRALLPGLLLPAAVVVIVLLGIEALRMVRPVRARRFLSESSGSFRDWRILGAGVLLGLATSVRVLGPYAGALVVAWMLARGKGKALPAVLAYAVIALLVAYVTWPYLWGNPVARAIASMNLMAHYQWEGLVLFDGNLYPESGLPAQYIPTLFSAQLTEPVLLLFAVSLPVVVYRFVKSRSGLDLILLLFFWAALPAIAVIVQHSTLYDNARQLYFLLPPIFIYTGVAISLIIAKLKSRLLRTGFLLIVALPGVLGIAQLHPYEYTFYNSLAGGSAGAFRRFDADYWLSASAEAARYVNGVAEPGARVLVSSPARVFDPYAREDLDIRDFSPTWTGNCPGYSDYLVISTKANEDLECGFGSLPTLATIGRQGMTYVVIKKGLAEPQALP